MTQYSMTSKATPEVVNAMMVYNLKTADYLSNRMSEIGHAEPYQELFSPLGNADVVYLPEQQKYRYKGSAWYHLAKTELPNVFRRSSVREKDRAAISLNKLKSDFERVVVQFDPRGETDSSRFGLALSLYTNYRNSTGGYHDKQVLYTLADCYRLVQVNADVNGWANILNVWDNRLPVDVLEEIASGMSVSVMLGFGFDSQEKAGWWFR